MTYTKPDTRTQIQRLKKRARFEKRAGDVARWMLEWENTTLRNALDRAWKVGYDYGVQETLDRSGRRFGVVAKDPSPPF